MVKIAVETEFLQQDEQGSVKNTGTPVKDRCANCGHLTKRRFCKRYGLSLVGENLELCTCESFTPRVTPARA